MVLGTMLRVPRIGSRDGVTLIELLIVIMIIGLLTTAALKAYDTSLQAARLRSTMRTLDELSAAIVGNPDLVSGGIRTDYGYVGDVGRLPEKIQDLVQRPADVDTGLWHGPYVLPKVAENPAGFVVDAWGDSLIYDAESLSITSRKGYSILQPSGWIVRKMAANSDVLLRNRFGGIIFDAKGDVPSAAKAESLRVVLLYPQNGRLITTDTLKGAAQIVNGNFWYPERITVGNHKLYVRYIPSPPDTAVILERTVSVYPGAKNRNWVEIHLPIPF